MIAWLIIAGVSSIGIFSSNYRIVGPCTCVTGFAMLQLAVGCGLMG
jgi:hypothetical protein